METWNGLINLRGKGGNGERLTKNVICIYELPMDIGNKVMKAWVDWVLGGGRQWGE